MNRTEAVQLTRLVKACCPAQAIDEFTPDAWAGLLEDMRLADCLDAVKAIARRQPFIAPAEIRAEVNRLRADRIDRVVLTPPPAVGDDPARYQAWLRAARRRVGDGETPTPTEGLRPLTAEQRTAIANTFRRVPDA